MPSRENILKNLILLLIKIEFVSMQKCLNSSFDHPYNQFSFKYYVSLYTRVRIYFTLKFILKDFNANKLNKSKHSIGIKTFVKNINKSVCILLHVF